MIILFFSSLSLAALAGLLALNSATLKAAKARQALVRTPTEQKLREEELERGRTQRRKNNELHGATAVRSNAHVWASEKETPVPGYVPVWVSNGIMSVIIYVTPFSVLPSLTVEVARLKAERAEWDASFLGRLVNGAQNTLAGAFVLLALSPLILLFCLPILGLCAFIGFPLLALTFVLAWCLNDFKNDVANTVVEKMKK